MMRDTPDGSVDPELPAIAPSSMPTDEVESTPTELSGKSPSPWGPWATVGLTVVCIVVLIAAQLVGAVIFLLFRIATTGSLKADDVATNGNLLAVATLLSTLSNVGLIALFVYLRRYPIRDYLALSWPPARSVWTAAAGLAVLLCGTDLTSYLLGKPLVPTLMVDIYKTSWLPALVLALVVLAPIGEETIFRGFLFKGIAASRAGPIWAIIISSVAFTSLHALQYDLYAVAGVAAMGFYLGFIRYRSGSLWLTMVLHAVANGVATVELIVQEHWFK